MRALVRWGPTEWIYKLVHPDFGIWFARLVSRWSYAGSAARDRFGPEPYRRYAHDKITADGFDFVVMGHRHDAEQQEFGRGTYLAIGDWIRDGSYGVFRDGELKLKYFA